MEPGICGDKAVLLGPTTLFARNIHQLTTERNPFAEIYMWELIVRLALP